MPLGSQHIVKYVTFFTLGLCSIQYSLLAEIRSEPRPEASRLTLELEASGSFSTLVDLIADSRVGLHGDFSPINIQPVQAPRVDNVDGVSSTIIFAQDDYLKKLIDYYGEYYQVDPILIGLIIEQESGYDPFALSPAGAMGLMQLMPDTAWMLGLDDPWDPEQNIEGGVRYFAQQMDRFQRVDLALAAYNAGPGAVEQWGGVPPYPETVDYVSNILGRYKTETEQPEEPAVYQEIPEAQYEELRD